jgi:Holliday junction resolvasome RuvABC endonuclease subunit
VSIRITSPAQAKALGIPGIKGKAKARERRPKAPPTRPDPPARLLALDPSSTAVGWAVFDAGKLRTLGVFRSAAENPMARIAKLATAVTKLSEAWQPNTVVLETVSGMHRHARSMSVATCAMAQGAIWYAIHAAGFHGTRMLVPIKENAWTKGTPKAKRADRVRLCEPIYAEFARRDGDKGLDGADAVGLGLWYLGGCR